MKIVFISRFAPPMYSGAGRNSFFQAVHLAQAGAEAKMLTLRFRPDLPTHEVIGGVELTRLPYLKANFNISTFIFHMQCAWWLFRYHRRYDVIQFSHMPKYWWSIYAVAKIFNKALLVTMTLFESDDLVSLSKRKLSRIEFGMLNRITGILAISRKLREISLPYVHNSEKIIYHTRAIDNTKFHPVASSEDKRTLRERFGIAPDDYVVLFSGSVIKRKGIDLLVEAWPAIKKTIPQARLVVAGPRQLDQGYAAKNDTFTLQLDKRIAELAIEDSVTFLGDQADHIPDLLRLADVFVFPSRREGLGMALIEAMATGLPVIICQFPWVPDNLVVHHQTGLRCEPTPDAIAQAVIHVYQHPDVAQTLGVNARDYAVQEHNAETLTNQLLQIYEAARHK